MIVPIDVTPPPRSHLDAIKLHLEHTGTIIVRLKTEVFLLAHAMQRASTAETGVGHGSSYRQEQGPTAPGALGFKKRGTNVV